MVDEEREGGGRETPEASRRSGGPEVSEIAGSAERVVPVAVYSDYTCPWCWIGAKRLDDLREELPESVALDVEWKPFEIHPEVPAEGMPVEDLHYTPEQWERMMEHLRAQAAREGLEMGNRPKVSNTHRALRAGSWVQAEVPDRFHAFHHAIFRAYFAEGRDLGDPEVIRSVAEAVGIDVDRMEADLEEGAFEDAVRGTGEEARRLGITGTPTFVFGERYAAVGAQPVERLRQAVESALEDPQAVAR